TARRADSIADICSQHGNRALPLALDVTDVRQRDDGGAMTEKKFGAVDVLVNNAGYGYLAAVEEGDEDEIRAMFETNFFALASLLRRVLPGMRARGRGHVVNISSVGGLIGNPGSSYYNATK